MSTDHPDFIFEQSRRVVKLAPEWRLHEAAAPFACDGVQLADAGAEFSAAYSTEYEVPCAQQWGWLA